MQQLGINPKTKKTILLFLGIDFFVPPNTKIECKGQQIGWLLLVIPLYLPNGKIWLKKVAEYVECTEKWYNPFDI